MGICYGPLLSSINEPKLNYWTLKNGTHCVTADMPDTALTCIDFWCKAGSSFEKAGEEGLAHFLEHMIFKGSDCLREGEFDLEIEALGGSSNAATGFDDVHFHVLIPPKVLSPAIELLLNLVLSPAIRPDAFSMEREVVLEEIAQYQDQPDEQVFKQLLETCWGAKHSYGRPILGGVKSLKASSPERMKAFHKRLYQSDNCCLAIAGHIPPTIKETIANSLLSKVKRISQEEIPEPIRQNLFFQKGRKEIKVKRLESARLLMAWPIPPARNQLMIMGADLATSLLSEGRRSRLVEHLRETLQIVESIEMDAIVLEEGGLIVLEACCLEEQLERVENEIKKILLESSESVPQIHEVERAKHLVRNGLCFSLESASHVAGLAGAQALWDRRQPLLAPLKNIDYWTGEKLKAEIFNLIKPELSCTLIAKPIDIC